MRWINSGGGPLIIIEKRFSTKWGGASKKKGIHYNIACDTSNYAEVKNIDPFDIVVLGDEPLQTTVINNKKDQFIVRWRYAESESDVLAALKIFKPEKPLESLSITWTTNELVLFDAAEIFVKGTKHLNIELLENKCIIETFEFSPKKDLSLLLHKISY
jgi:hypothetical protein